MAHAMTIRRVIYENYNDPDVPFTNDQILDVMHRSLGVDKSITVNDLEDTFEKMCDTGLVRNVAQNLRTIWFKLFDVMASFDCGRCGTVYLGGQESCMCPGCGDSLQNRRT